MGTLPGRKPSARTVRERRRRRDSTSEAIVDAGRGRGMRRSSLWGVSTGTAMMFFGLSRESGARGRTRTDTPVKASGPKPGASTNFATRAHGSEANGGHPSEPERPRIEDSGEPAILGPSGAGKIRRPHAPVFRLAE